MSKEQFDYHQGLKGRITEYRARLDEAVKLAMLSNPRLYDDLEALEAEVRDQVVETSMAFFKRPDTGNARSVWEFVMGMHEDMQRARLDYTNTEETLQQITREYEETMRRFYVEDMDMI